MEPIKKVSGPAQRYRAFLFQGYVIAASISLTVLAILSRYNPYFPFDLFITKTFQLLNNPIFLKFMEFISYWGFEPAQIIIIIFSIIALFLLQLRLESILMIINTVGIYVLGSFLKLLVQRQRPPSDLVRVVTVLHDYGFPSGHVLTYTAFFGFLAFLVFDLGQKSHTRSFILAIFLSLIFFIGPSRVYLGEHWTSDVVGGYLLGSLWLIFIIRLYRQARENRIDAKTHKS